MCFPEIASYTGTVSRVHSSGAKTRYGRVHPGVNRYLKWALVEAANVIVMHQKRLGDVHVVRCTSDWASVKATAEQ